MHTREVRQGNNAQHYTGAVLDEELPVEDVLGRGLGELWYMRSKLISNAFEKTMKQKSPTSK